MDATWPYDDEQGAAGGSCGAGAVTWRNRFLLLADRVLSPLALCAADGTILLANPAMAAEWGRAPGQLPGRNALELFRPRETGQLERLTEALRLGRRSRYPLAVRWHTPTAVSAGDATGAARQGELTVDPVSAAAHERPALLLQLRVHEQSDEAGPVEAACGPGTPSASPAETRILALAAAGRTTAGIASVTGLTVDGVNYHLSRLARRWRVPNRTALVARAYVLGVLPQDSWPPAPEA